jgi:hypothetical protein
MRVTRSSLSFAAAFSRSPPHRSSVSSRSRLAAGDILELLAVKFLQVVHQPVIDAVGQQQHLDAPLAEHFEVRAAPRGVEVLATT